MVTAYGSFSIRWDPKLEAETRHAADWQGEAATSFTKVVDDQDHRGAGRLG